MNQHKHSLFRPLKGLLGLKNKIPSKTEVYRNGYGTHFPRFFTNILDFIYSMSRYNFTESLMFFATKYKSIVLFQPANITSIVMNNASV